MPLCFMLRHVCSPVLRQNRPFTAKVGHKYGSPLLIFDHMRLGNEALRESRCLVQQTLSVTTLE